VKAREKDWVVVEGGTTALYRPLLMPLYYFLSFAIFTISAFKKTFTSFVMIFGEKCLKRVILACPVKENCKVGIFKRNSVKGVNRPTERKTKYAMKWPRTHQGIFIVK
jgi:hypothetical protein